MYSKHVAVRSRLVAAASFVALQSGAGNAVAQQSAEQSQVSVGEVIVTARRREERLQDVPLAVTALSGDALERASISRTDELMQKAPGLTVQPSSFGRADVSFGMRSQRQYLVYMTVDQSVGVYQDEVYQARTNGLNTSLFDLESVQVLKGPQGTLFGRNTPGGAILFTSKKPGQTIEGYGRMTFGNYNRVESEMALSLPVNDRFGLRLAAKMVKRDGFTENLSGPDLDDENSKAVRAVAVLRPTDAIENTTVVNWMSAQENGTAFKAVPLPADYQALYVGANRFGAARAATGPVLSELARRDFHTVSLNQPVPGAKVQTIGGSNTTTWKLSDNITIKNVYGYRFVKALNAFDFDGTPASVFVSQEFQRSEQHSDELQLQGDAFDNRLSYIVGGFYFKEDGFDQQNSNGRVSGGDISNKSYAVFAQGSYKLPWVEGLTLTAGVRQTRDEREYVARNRNPDGTCRIPVNDAVPTVTLNPCALALSATFDQPTYTLSLDYRVNPGLLVYITNRRGYRTGGFTFAGTRRAEFEPFDPETVDDVEIGFKSDFRLLGGPARVNAAAYYDKYKDIQRTASETRVEAGQSFPVTLTRNAAQANIRGFEVEGNWRPSDLLELSAFWNYSKPQYDEWTFTTSGRTVDYTNQPFSFAPRNTYGAAVTFNLPLDEALGEVSLRADVFYQDVMYAQDVVYDITNGLPNVALGVIPKHTTGNVRADWGGVFGSNVDLAVFVKNVTDEEYFIGGVDLTTSVGTNVRMLGEPRTYGVQMGIRF